MDKRFLLPGTELTVCPVAFGTVRAGIAWSGPDADRMLDAYLDMGGNVLDTARIYIPPKRGCGEKVLGEWLHRSGKRRDVVLMTKGGHPPLGNHHCSRLTMKDMTDDLEESLAALGTDYIDVYYYHRDDPAIPAGVLVEQMEEFVRQGKIRYYACSNWSTERMQEADAYAAAHGLRGFVASQCLYNAGAKHMHGLKDDTLVIADDAMLRYHQTAANTLTPYSSLANGFFHLLAKDPETARSREYYSEGNLRTAERLQAVCQQYGCTITQALLGYLLTLPMPVMALAGASRMEQLEDMMGTLNISFRGEDFSGI